jgi:hypothetical protein
MDSTSNLQPPTFTRKNYELWSLTMKVLFQVQDVLEIIKHGYVELVDHEAYNALTQVNKDALKYQRKNYGKEMFCIHQAIHEIIIQELHQ